MAGRSMTRNGGAGIFQISEKRYVAIRKIKGSACWMATECYPCGEAPTGWYTGHDHQYIEARSELEAASQFSDMCRDGKVALLTL